MSPNLPFVPISLYRFSYLAGEDLHLPTDPRGLWHGVFGMRLRELACVLPGTECPACLLLHQCPYSHIFSGPRPPEAELMRRYDTIPVPHAFRVNSPGPETIGAGATLDVSLVLVGNANERVPLVIQAMAAAGQEGLGKGRGRAWLQHVIQALPDGTAPQTIATKGRLLSIQPPKVPVAPPTPAAIRLEFLSPYKPSGQPTRGDGFDLGHLLMAIVRRVSLLQYFYTGVRLEAPFPELKATSEGARIIHQALRRQESSRFAARHGKRLDTGGLVGNIDLDLTGIEPLWPYLHLGQWLNVGKNASMGYGRYGVAAFTGDEPGP